MIAINDLVRFCRAIEDDEEEAAQIRAFEQAAIAFIEKDTGWYFGPVATLVDELPASWPLVLRAEPRATLEDPDEIVVTLESRGAAWESVDSSSWYTSGRYVWPYSSNSALLYRSYLPNRYRVTYTGGYETDSQDSFVWAAPEDIKMHVRQLVATWYENREGAVVGTGAAEVPLSITMGLQHYRI